MQAPAGVAAQGGRPGAPGAGGETMLGERIVALVVGALGVMAVWQARQLPSQATGIGAGTLPGLLGLALIVLAVLLLASSRGARPAAAAAPENEAAVVPGGGKRVAGAVAILALYLALNQAAGFLLATIVFGLLFLGLLFRVPWPRAGAWSVLLSVLVWALFRAFLHVPLPRGLLAGWL